MVRALVSAVPLWVKYVEIFVIGSTSSSFLYVSDHQGSFQLLLAHVRTLVPNLEHHGLRDYPVSLVPLRWNRGVGSNLAGLQCLHHSSYLASLKLDRKCEIPSGTTGV